MYAHIRGTVSEILPDRVVLDACGVGYELFCSAQTRKCLRAGAEHKLYVHFHISLSQDVMALYGFETQEERAMFRPADWRNARGAKAGALRALNVERFRHCRRDSDRKRRRV